MREWLTDCLHCDKEGDGYDCIMTPPSCQRPPQEHDIHFRESGICRYYIEGHPCNPDGTVIKEESNGS